MKQDIDVLLQKRMDRKDFLKHLAVGFAALSGVAAVLKTLGGLGDSSGRGAAYGINTYGGSKARRFRQNGA